MTAFTAFTNALFVVYFYIRFTFESIRRLANIIFIRLTAKWGRKQYVTLPEGDEVPTISFAGGGMLWTYYLGVARYIYTHFDHSRIKILVSSAGSYGGIPLALGLDPYEWCKHDWAKCLQHFASRRCGMFFDHVEFYKQLWDDYLPADAHKRLSGRLFISITLFPSFQNRVVSQFDTRDELISCIVASSCFPVVFVRNMPITSFGLAFDGGLTNDQPCLNENTITVSCINLTADVSPKCRHDHEIGGATETFHEASRFSLFDMIQVPDFERVWRIAGDAEHDASLCHRFHSSPQWRAIVL